MNFDNILFIGYQPGFTLVNIQVIDQIKYCDLNYLNNVYYV